MKAPKIEELDNDHTDERLDPELDPYPAGHPDLMSETCGGDCCPRCGEHLEGDEHVKHINGDEGIVWELAEDSIGIPVYHVTCWRERMAEKAGEENASLESWR